MRDRIKVCALKNKPDFILANDFEIGVKPVKILELFEFFFILNNVFVVLYINLPAAFATGVAVTGSVVFAPENSR